MTLVLSSRSPSATEHRWQVKGNSSLPSTASKYWARGISANKFIKHVNKHQIGKFKPVMCAVICNYSAMYAMIYVIIGKSCV